MSAKLYLHFDKSVPVLTRRLVRRWVKRLHLHDWTVFVYYVRSEDFPADRGPIPLASALPDPGLLRAHIWINSEAGREEIEETVKHELLHLRYSAISQVFTQAWDGRRKMRKADALRLIADKIEEMIERDCKIL